MKDKAFPSCAPSASPWIVQEQRVDVNVGLSLTNSVLEQEPENTGNMFLGGFFFSWKFPIFPETLLT